MVQNIPGSNPAYVMLWEVGGGVYVENNNILSLSMLHAGNSHNLNEGCLPANPVYGFLMLN